MAFIILKIIFLKNTIHNYKKSKKIKIMRQSILINRLNTKKIIMNFKIKKYHQLRICSQFKQIGYVSKEILSKKIKTMEIKIATHYYFKMIKKLTSVHKKFNNNIKY